MTEPTSLAGTSRKPRRMARELNKEPKKAEGAVVPDVTASRGIAGKRITKTDTLLGMLHREEGATLEQMVAATGWLPHTTRAALTGLKKKGHEVSSKKAAGVRTYHIPPAGDAA